MIARRILVRGDVQGVGFRWHTKEQARALGLCGWVRNLLDGRVEVQLEGAESTVEEMIQWLRRGPATAHVAGIECLPSEAEGQAGFRVLLS